MRKCVPIRAMHFTRFSTRQLRHPPRSPLQNRPELLVALESAVVAESVLVQIALQVLRRNRVIHAANASLNQHPETFNRVGVNILVDVLSGAMLDVAMAIAKGLPVFVAEKRNASVARKFIGVDHTFRHNVLLDNAGQCWLSNVWNSLCHNLSVALNDCDDWNLFLVSAHRTTAPVLPYAANVGFVYLNRWSLQLHIALRKQRANLPEHAPCGFVGDTCLTLYLLRRDSAAGRTHEVHCVEPQPQRSACLLEDGSLERIDVIAAIVASIGCAIAHAMMLALFAALEAMRHTTGPSLFSNIRQARIIVRKLVVELPHGVAQLFGNALFDSHRPLTELILANCLTCCQGIITNC